MSTVSYCIFFLTEGTLKFKWNFIDFKINKWMLNTLFSFQEVYRKKFKSRKHPAVVREQMIWFLVMKSFLFGDFF